MLSRVSRWMRGCVSFSALCPEPERLVNHIRQQNLHVFGIRLQEYNLSGWVWAADYKDLSRCAHRCGGRCRATTRVGFPFWKRRFRHRYGWWIGWCFFVAFLAAAPQFVWEIRLPDCSEEAKIGLEQLLEEEGIVCGMPISSLEPQKMAERMMRNSDDFGWIALNRTGSVLEVEVSERVDAPIAKPETTYDLVASRAGEILTTKVLVGVGVVEAGDVVLPGDLLISGVSPGASMQRVCAEGSIVAKTTRVQEFYFSYEQQQDVVVGQESFYGIQWMSRWLDTRVFQKTPENTQAEVVETVEPLTLWGQELPFGWRKTSYLYTRSEPVWATATQAKAAAEEAFAAFEEEELSQITVISMEETVEEEKDGMHFRRVYTCHEEITQKSAVGATGMQNE